MSVLPGASYALPHVSTHSTVTPLKLALHTSTSNTACLQPLPNGSTPELPAPGMQPGTDANRHTAPQTAAAACAVARAKPLEGFQQPQPWHTIQWAHLLLTWLTMLAPMLMPAM